MTDDRGYIELTLTFPQERDQDPAAVDEFMEYWHALRADKPVVPGIALAPNDSKRTLAVRSPDKCLSKLSEMFATDRTMPMRLVRPVAETIAAYMVDRAPLAEATLAEWLYKMARWQLTFRIVE